MPDSKKAAPSIPLAVAPVRDARNVGNAKLIGENQQGRHPVPVYASTYPAPFVNEVLSICLRAWGVKIAEDAPLRLESELVTLFAVEANKYRGEARLRFKLVGSDEKVLWEGIESGEDYTWGMSMKPANYSQVLSNALRGAYAQLLANEGFQAAWSGRAALAAPQLAPSEMKAVILKMMADGIGSEVIASYVRSINIVPALTPEQISEWKREGIAEPVIAAALERH